MLAGSLYRYDFRNQQEVTETGPVLVFSVFLTAIADCIRMYVSIPAAPLCRPHAGRGGAVVIPETDGEDRASIIKQLTFKKRKAEAGSTGADLGGLESKIISVFAELLGGERASGSSPIGPRRAATASWEPAPPPARPGAGGGRASVVAGERKTPDPMTALGVPIDLAA